jgi:two-component system nitrate/nitrite response regulator NarL
VTGSLRVVLADDHAPTREAVCEALEAHSCEVVAAVATGPAAVNAALELRPDVCLLDIHMPGSGIVAAAEITRALSDTAVVMLTASDEDDDLFAALRAGASGYLLKAMELDRVGASLRAVLAGESVLPRWLLRRVAEHFEPAPRRRIPLPHRSRAAELTEREAQVLDLMGQGLSTEQMAQKMFVAPVTVRTHVAAILRKLQVKTRKEAVRLARRESGPLGDRFTG